MQAANCYEAFANICNCQSNEDETKDELETEKDLTLKKSAYVSFAFYADRRVTVAVRSFSRSTIIISDGEIVETESSLPFSRCSVFKAAGCAASARRMDMNSPRKRFFFGTGMYSVKVNILRGESILTSSHFYIGMRIIRSHV